MRRRQPLVQKSRTSVGNSVLTGRPLAPAGGSMVTAPFLRSVGQAGGRLPFERQYTPLRPVRALEVAPFALRNPTCLLFFCRVASPSPHLIAGRLLPRALSCGRACAAAGLAGLQIWLFLTRPRSGTVHPLIGIEYGSQAEIGLIMSSLDEGLRQSTVVRNLAPKEVS